MLQELEMGLASQLFEFFSPVRDLPRSEPGRINEPRPPTLGEFLAAVKNYRALEAAQVCAKMVDSGFLLMVSPPAGAGSLMLQSYMSNYEVVRHPEYGTCDFVVFGFPYIRTHFINSVLAFVVVHASGKPDIGTGFLTEGRFLITAAHCIKDMKCVTIRGWSSAKAALRQIVVSADNRTDLAVLEFGNDPFPGVPGFRLAEPQVLDEVLVMGYPPVPGFQSVLVSETAQIAGHIQSFTGEVIAASEAILDRQNYLLVSARVKGGNSGGPVINDRGEVVGIVSFSPSGSEGELDPLAYAAAVPSSVLHEVLAAMGEGNQKLERVEFAMTEPDCFRTHGL